MKNKIFTDHMKNIRKTLANIASTTSQFVRPNAAKLFSFFYLTSQSVNAQNNSSSSEGLSETALVILDISLFLGLVACVASIHCAANYISPIEERPHDESLREPLLDSVEIASLSL